MLKLTKIVTLLLFFTSQSFAKTIIVKNIAELNTANKVALPGDKIILQNGEWHNVKMKLDCIGNEKMPITFKAETAGKVIITGKSSLSIAGKFIVVDGLYFTNGYAGTEAVITFRTNKDDVANNCKLTNTVINNFNNPKRLDENYWIELYGKNNRIEFCSFLNKKNIGVLMAVILNDEKSQKNFHSINHNYFGIRTPLASNGGEIIRVGVSEQCEFNSNTQITDNFFEHCDGETEIISIKSCANLIKNNFFKECQGAVVLRHGNYNTVMNNIFYGNGKEGTGGVRIINKGQWVVNNLFYKCRGTGFRAPLAIMNGIPNSPAFRYLAVTDAVVATNSFYECSAFSLCEGSDAERSLAPKNVFLINNIFYNKTDSLLYRAFDDMSGINFAGNITNISSNQNLERKFVHTKLSITNIDGTMIPVSQNKTKYIVSDSLQKAALERLSEKIALQPSFANSKLLQKIKLNAVENCGANWFVKKDNGILKSKVVNCFNAEDLALYLQGKDDEIITINLTGTEYLFTKPLNISGHIIINSLKKNEIKFSFKKPTAKYLFHLNGGGSLNIKNSFLNLTDVGSVTFIITDTSSSSNHTNFKIQNSTISNSKKCFFYAVKSSVCDSIVISKTNFINNNGIIFNLQEEDDKKGYYPVEKIMITHSNFTKLNGQIINLLRSGRDESTMGPKFIFNNNKVVESNTAGSDALITLNGVQFSNIEKNVFEKSNTEKKVIMYKDEVRANHLLKKNTFIISGGVDKNEFVRE